MRLFLACFVAAALLSSCMGRDSDVVSGQLLDRKSLDLSLDKPALVVFAALWCKPCRAEIPDLNQLHLSLGESVQVVNVLVEGSVKGRAAEKAELSQFSSYKGEKPIYPLRRDPEWKLFDSFNPKEGHRLPTMLFVSRSGVITQLIQRSLDAKSELLPMVQALIAGDPVIQKPVGPEDPIQNPENPKPDPDDPKPDPVDPPVIYHKMSFEQWQSQSGVVEGDNIYENLFDAWDLSCEKYGFSAEDVPFLGGVMRVKQVGDIYTPISSSWSYVSENGQCSLTIWYNPDGSLNRSSGVCI